jgi:hypothetical protein
VKVVLVGGGGGVSNFCPAEKGKKFKIGERAVTEGSTSSKEG